MQTIERPTESAGAPRPKKDGLITALVGLALLPVLVLLIMTKWGVVIGVALAAVFALGLWVRRRGFIYIEVVAFLIHFDGLGYGPVRSGRVVAAVTAVYLLYKLFIEKWRPPAIPTRHWFPPLLLTVLALASGAWATVTNDWFYAMGLLGLALAFYGVSAMLVDRHEKVLQFLRAYWYGGLWGSALGVLALFLGTRSVGFGGDPNFFGILEASMIPLTVYYRRQAKTPKEKWLYTLALAFVLAGAAGAGSRSGLIGGAVAIVGTMITRPGLTPGRRARAGVMAVVLAALAFVVGFVANPNNLERGFADRGAGRLDIWTVSFDVIGDSPIIGHGFGQQQGLIPQRLATTPGVADLSDKREDVSAHNTWLDLLGDFGVVGLVIFTSMLVITLIGFIRPRWQQTKELSNTLTIMMLPVFVGANFLPLINNKLAWSLIGLSSALQVPSVGTRWRGFVARPDRAALPRAGRRRRAKDTTEPATPSAGEVERSGAVTTDASGRVAGATLGYQEPELARWDVRVSRRFRMSLALGALVGFVVFGTVMSNVPVKYKSTGSIFVPSLDAQNRNFVVIDQEQIQVFHTMVESDAYAAALKELSGIPLSVPDIRERMEVTRNQWAAFLELTFTDTNEANAELVKPFLVTALDNVLAGNREFAAAAMADERRPMEPGEQRYYTGELYIPVYREGTSGTATPRTAWASIIGALTGMLVATGFMLLQQRKPRVNNDDDLLTMIGLGVWTHVGRAGRRFTATPDQYAQVVASARQMYHGDEDVRRIVIATPEPDRAARALAMGTAAALAAEGRRVLLVDAQVDRPLLTGRIAGVSRRSGFGRAGLVDVVTGDAGLADVVHRVSRRHLPLSVRRTLGRSAGELRFIGAGRTLGRTGLFVRPEVLDRFDDDVVVVVLAPSLLSSVPAGPTLAWGDAVVLAMVEGRTVTYDAEDAAVQMHTFVVGAPGVVMLDV